jgi:hypothetical protein
MERQGGIIANDAPVFVASVFEQRRVLAGGSVFPVIVRCGAERSAEGLGETIRKQA